MTAAPANVLVVDLNNFARYPTIAVGYLASILRKAGMQVSVLSPLALGVPGIRREPRPGRWALLGDRMRQWSATSAPALIRSVRRAAVGVRERFRTARTHRIATEVRSILDGGRFDAVLVSTYLMYRPVCERIGEACAGMGVPMLVGGPYFFQPEVAETWRNVPGLTALVGGEVEPRLAELVGDAAASRDLSRFPGVFLPAGPRGAECPPLKDLDSLPFPDYADFPWSRYPNRIVPMITGRGCGWGACTFCSDVTSSMGRTYRSRSPENVLDEAEHQGARHDAKLFVFTDLKLNSDLRVWRALLGRFQSRVPGGRWIGSVHIGTAGENGLSDEELRAARAAGMVRLTTGLESGSQRVLDAMAKGTDLAVTSRAIHAAAEAGISVRTTMILGYPGERAEDVEASARFLRGHTAFIDRVRLNRFQIVTGTRFHRRLEQRPSAFPGLTHITINHGAATIGYRYKPASERPYRRAVASLLAAVHVINRKPLPDVALDLEGVM